MSLRPLGITRVTGIVAAATIATGGCVPPAVRDMGAVARQLVPIIDDIREPTPVRVINLENRSTTAVAIYSVTLTACNNVKQPCDVPAAINLHLAPGQRVELKRVEPLDPTKAFNYRYTFQWRLSPDGEDR